jgi:16S rRNA (guanine527-N7)-methyltransferase
VEPGWAADIFGPALPVVRRYADLLTGAGVTRGLVGPREAPRLWDRHLGNCAVVQAAVPTGASVCDVGSGAGLPGLVLAAVRPDLEVTLVDSVRRRTDFLEEAVRDLGLANVRVLRGRAEELAGAVRVDVVTARAVAPLERLVRWCLPLTVPGGSLLALKGEQAEGELSAAVPTLRAMGARDWAVDRIGSYPGGPEALVVRVVAGAVVGATVTGRTPGGRPSGGRQTGRRDGRRAARQVPAARPAATRRRGPDEGAGVQP